jgi:hypothetical protein
MSEPTAKNDILDAIVALHDFTERGLRLLRTEFRNELGTVNGRIDSLRFDMNKRFDAVDQRFDAVDQRFDRVDVRLDRLERRRA